MKSAPAIEAQSESPAVSLEAAIEELAKLFARHIAEALSPMLAKHLRAPAEVSASSVELRPLLTVREAAELLRVSRATAYELVRTHAIPSINLGRRIVIPAEKLLEMISAENNGLGT